MLDIRVKSPVLKFKYAWVMSVLSLKLIGYSTRKGRWQVSGLMRKVVVFTGRHLIRGEKSEVEGIWYLYRWNN